MKRRNKIELTYFAGTCISRTLVSPNVHFFFADNNLQFRRQNNKEDRSDRRTKMRPSMQQVKMAAKVVFSP